MVNVVVNYLLCLPFVRLDAVKCILLVFFMSHSEIRLDRAAAVNVNAHVFYACMVLGNKYKCKFGVIAITLLYWNTAIEFAQIIQK